MATHTLEELSPKYPSAHEVALTQSLVESSAKSVERGH